MSYKILEALRRTLVLNIDAAFTARDFSGVTIGNKVRPENSKGQQRFDVNDLPLITFACLTNKKSFSGGFFKIRCFHVGYQH